MAALVAGCSLPEPTPAQPAESAGSWRVGGGPYAVRVADLDGDGLLDSVSANLLGESISVLSGGAPGRPAWRTDRDAGGIAVALAVGDFDGDGRSDVGAAVRSRLGHLAVFAGRPGPGAGPGGLSRHWVYGTPNDVAAGDLDADGRDEAVVALREDALVVVDGGERRRVGLPGCAGHTGYGPDGVTLADLDGDGTLDAAVACYDTWSVQVLRGDGRGGLGAPERIGAVPEERVRAAMRVHASEPLADGFALEGGLRKVAAADLDADGWNDLVAVGDYGLLLVAYGNGRGFGSPRVADTGVDGTNNLAIADLDGDGGLDLAITTGMQPALLRVPAAGLRAGRAEPVRVAGLPKTPESLVLRDLDGDGHLDLVVAGEHADALGMLRGDGRGGFAPFAAAPRAPADPSPR